MKIAIVGCGAAAKRYYITALKRHLNEMRELFLVDLNPSLAEELKAEIGMGTIIRDYREIVYKSNGAIISLPNFLHYDVGMEFLKAGCHVLCEKPLADSSAQSLEMVKKANETGAKLCVNNTRRMFPSFNFIKDKITSGELGRITKITYTEGAVFGWPSETGFYVNPKLSNKGILSDLGPHVLDTICWWLDCEPKVTKYEDDSFGGPESVSKIYADMGDKKVEIFLNRLVDLESNYEIYFEKGRLFGNPIDWALVNESNDKNETKVHKLNCKQKNYPAFVIPIVDNFFKVVKNNAVPLISGQDVLHSLNMIDSCYQQRQRFYLSWYDSVPIQKRDRQSTVLVTGAAGFIGGSIVEELYLSKQKRVKAAIHSWSSAARIGRFPIDMIQFDLLDKKSIRNALEDVDEIIHCAKGDYEATVDGTRNLLEIAGEKKIKRIIYLSTTDVYGNLEGHITEEHPISYTGNEYNRMKVDAENVCRECIKEGAPITIIRPSIVYGPFSKNWTIHFAKLLKCKEIGKYEEIGEGKCNLIYIKDLVNFIISAMEQEQMIGEIFNVVGPDVVSWNEFFEKFNNALDLSTIKTIKKSNASMKTNMLMPVRKIGGFVRDHMMEPVKWMAENYSLANSFLRYLEGVLKKTPANDELKLYSKAVVYNRDKAANVLDLTTMTSLEKGLSQCAAWLKHHAII